MGMEIALMLAGVILGAIPSWLISRWFYRRSTVEMPDWAKNVPQWAIPLIESLPEQPVTVERIIQLYQDALDSGKLDPDPLSGYVACPSCGAPSSEFET